MGEAGTPPSLHRYLYAYSNPTVYIDLYGYESESLNDLIYDTHSDLKDDADSWWKESEKAKNNADSVMTEHRALERMRSYAYATEAMIKEGLAFVVPANEEELFVDAASAYIAPMLGHAASYIGTSASVLLNKITRKSSGLVPVAKDYFVKLSKETGDSASEYAFQIIDGQVGGNLNPFSRLKTSIVQDNSPGFQKFVDHVGNQISERLIPGTPGTVSGGSSTTLGKNMLETMGVKRSSKWSGYQAQHVIPSEVSSHPIIQKIGLDFDDAYNGLFLRIPDEATSAMSRHRGYHSVYNEVVEKSLSRIDVNQSVDVLQKQVFNLQQKLKVLQQKGTPLYPSQGATVELWERLLNK